MPKELSCEDFRTSLAAYCTWMLDPIQVRRMDAHQKTCPGCEQAESDFLVRIIENGGMANLERPGRRDPCLSQQTFDEYWRGGLADDETRVLEAHLGSCVACRQRAAVVRADVETGASHLLRS